MVKLDVGEMWFKSPQNLELRVKNLRPIFEVSAFVINKPTEEKLNNKYSIFASIIFPRRRA